MSVGKKTEIRKYMIFLCIVGFCICIVNYQSWVRSYNTTMLALSYEYGFTSRSLLGTLYHGLNAILPIDIMQYNAVLVFAMVATGLIYIFLMFFVYKCLCRLEGKALKYAEYALMLLSICVISTFTFAYNYLRVDIFMIATSLAAVLAMFNKKTEWLTIVFSAIGVMFHQGFVLMYFNIILVLLFYKWMTDKKAKYAFLFFSSFIIGSVLFIWFELLSRSKGTQIFDTILQEATNLSPGGIYHTTLLYHEVLGIDVSGAETSFVHMNHVQFILFVICCLPIIIYIFRFFITLIRKGEDIPAKLKYLAGLVGSLTIMPDMMFKVDYGRWVMAIAAYYIVIIVGMAVFEDKLVLEQIEKDYIMMKSHPYVIILCIMPIIIVPFLDVDIDMLTKNWQRWFQSKDLIFY